jgi:hypothetical protein
MPMRVYLDGVSNTLGVGSKVGPGEGWPPNVRLLQSLTSKMLGGMSLEVWWPLLQQESRNWLVAHNGEALSAQVLDDLVRVGGAVPSAAWWVGENGPDGLYLSDAGIDWVEAVANGELQDAPSDR